MLTQCAGHCMSYLFLHPYNIKHFFTRFGQHENVMWTERGGRKLHVGSNLNGFNIKYEYKLWRKTQK